MIGAVQKNVGSVNEDFSFTNDIITHRIITVTKSGNNISDYNDLSGKKLAVVTDIAKAALDKNATIKNSNKNTLYPTIEDALSALEDMRLRISCSAYVYACCQVSTSSLAAA